MAVKFTAKQGIEEELPRLYIGEFGLATDTNKLFIGTGSGNMVVATLSNQDITALWENSGSSVRLYGGVISDNGDGSVSITNGSGLSKMYTAPLSEVPDGVNDGQGSNLAVVTWDAIASLQLVDQANNYIYYDKYTDSILATTSYDDVDINNDFLIGSVYRDGTTVLIYNLGDDSFNLNRRVHMWGREIAGKQIPDDSMLLNYSDLHISHNGGVLWIGALHRFEIDPFDTSLEDTFTYWYKDSDGNFVKTLDQDSIDNGNFNHSSGDLALVPDGRYSVHWIYVLHTGDVHVVYGVDSYTKIEAQSVEEPDLPEMISTYGVLIGYATVLSGALSIEDIYRGTADQRYVSPINKYNETLFVKTDRQQVIYHGLGSKNIQVSIVDYDTGDLLDTEIVVVDENTVNLNFGDVGTVNRVILTILG